MDSKVIKELINEIQINSGELKKYKDYYEGNHRIITDYKNNPRGANNIEVHNFCGMFIESNVGYLLGNPISLKYNTTDIEDENLVDLYYNQLGDSIQQIDQKLMQYQQTYGYTYEINYIDKNGEFAVEVVSPLTASVKREGKKVVNALIKTGRNTTDGIDYYDFYIVRENRVLEIGVKNGQIQADSIQSRYNPINNPIIVVQNNWECKSEIKDIILLNDSYNTISSDLANEISDNRNSYLQFKGVKLTKETLADMNRQGIMAFPNEQGGAQFLTRDVNDRFVQNKLDQLKEQIYTITGQVDFNDTGVGSNSSSLALRNKLTNLNNRLSLKEGFIREAIVLRLRNFSEYLTKISKKYNEELIDYNKVDISFIKNIPTSGLETAQKVGLLYEKGIISKETAISELSFVSDPREEIRRIEEEKESVIDNEMSMLFNNTLQSRVAEVEGE